MPALRCHWLFSLVMFEDTCALYELGAAGPSVGLGPVASTFSSLPTLDGLGGKRSRQKPEEPSNSQDRKAKWRPSVVIRSATARACCCRRTYLRQRRGAHARPTMAERRN
jgi:hypothetical protein